MAKTKFTSSARKAPQRGTPEFERDYLLRMGYVRQPDSSVELPSSDWPEHDQLIEVISCCEFLLPVAEAGSAPGNAVEVVASWLRGLSALARQRLANPSGV